MGVATSGPSSDAGHATCVRRVALERAPRPLPRDDVDGASPLWFVKVTIGGDPLGVTRVHEELEMLSHDRAFVVSVRYDTDCAEVRYWDEGPDAAAAIRQALGLWGDAEVLGRCERESIAYVPYFPLGGGGHRLDPGRLAGVATRHDATAAQVALAWLLATSPVTLPIPGTGSLAHLAENVAAVDLRLTAEDLRELSG